MEANKLKVIAEDAVKTQFATIISNLKEQALLGENYIIVEELSELLVSKLHEKGFKVTQFYKKERTFFFFKKNKKYFKIRF